MRFPASGAAPPTAERAQSRRLAFERLAVRRMPGFETAGFTLDDLSPGVNVIHGPNASGKTTAARALRLLLWPRAGDAEASAAAVLALDGERWEVDLDRDRVRYRRDGAPTDAPPPLPPADAADRYALALHELLRPEARGEGLAAEVAREAAGGYDLEAARDAAGARPKPRNPQKLRAEYEAAAARVREVEEEQRRIEAEARGLGRLERELAAAREAKARLERVDAALEWARCRERLARAEEELAGFPAAMERLRGEERERLDEYRDRLAAAREDRARAVAGSEEARQALAAAALPEKGLPEGLLDELEERRERLASLEQEIAQCERERAEAESRRDEAWRELGGEADEERLSAFRPGDWKEVLDLVRRADAIRLERLELDALAAWVGEAASAAELDRRLDDLGAEARLLRDWLREPAGGWRARGPALAGALALAAVAVAGGLLLHPGLWALAAVAFAVVLWCWLDVRREAGARTALEDQHRRLRRAAGLVWRPEAVASRLREVEEGVAAIRAELQRAERGGELGARERRLEEKVEALEVDRRDLVARLGLAPSVGPEDGAPLAALVHALCRWREAKDGVAAAEAAVGAARRRHAGELEAVRRCLEPYGGPGEVVDAASARGAIAALGRRSEAHGRAREAMARLTADLGRADQEIERAAASARDLFVRLELADGDDRALEELLDRLKAYQAAVQACRDAGAEHRLAEAKIAPGDELRDRDVAALAAEREAAAETAARLEELAARLGRVRSEVERAKRKHDLEVAQAGLEAAEEALREEREREADAAAAWALAEWVRERTRGVRRPAVMSRAAALFARITGGAFRLVDPVGDPPVFRAEDTRAGATRDLAELSSGRRLQLLVAVRMAFVEALERGVRVPLVMDETLANSDDTSATALIEAVLELAREGRQVFYFTAQDDEVSKWREALEAEDGLEWRVADLGAIRRLERERRARRREWLPRRREVPAPGALGRAEYGARLGVPGLDPREEPGAVHLWYLVEEVDVLHGLLVRNLECWGELEALAADAGADLLGGGPEGTLRQARVTARARCLQVLFRAWRSGRGRPVDRRALGASGAVSERFLDEVSDLAERAGGDATALLAGLEAGEVRGFRSEKTEQLAAYLREEGYLDDRPVLTAAQLREAALSELGAEIAAGEITLDAVDELLAQMPS